MLGFGLACVVLLAAPLAARAAPTKMRVDQVEVKDCPTLKAFVSVRDASNNPVKGLKSRKFGATVAKGRAPKVVAKSFEKSDEGMAVVVVMDLSYSMYKKMKAQRDATSRRGRKAMEVQKDSVVSFMQNLKKANDRVAVVTFGQEVLLVREMSPPNPATQNLVKLLNHDPRGSKHSKLHDGVFKALEIARAESNLPKRRALVVFSDGMDQGSTREMAECIDEAKKAGIAVHTVGISGLKVKAENLDHLKRLAEDTRGSYSEAPDEQTLTDLHKGIVSQLKDIYVLTFSAPDLRGDGKERDLKVTLEVSKDKTLKATRRFIIPTKQKCPYDVRSDETKKDDTTIVKYEKPLYEEPWFFPAILGVVLVIGVVAFVLVMRKKKQQQDATVRARRCPECGQLKPEAGMTCPFCPKDEPAVPTFVPPAPEPKAPPPPVVAQLLIISGGPHGAKGHSFDLIKQTTVLGRDDNKCDILLPDDKASNVHATIFLGTEGFEVHDLKSTNGTFINEQKLEDEDAEEAVVQLLNHGDEIRIGRLRMKFFDKR